MNMRKKLKERVDGSMLEKVKEQEQEQEQVPSVAPQLLSVYGEIFLNAQHSAYCCRYPFPILSLGCLLCRTKLLCSHR